MQSPKGLNALNLFQGGSYTIKIATLSLFISVGLVLFIGNKLSWFAGDRVNHEAMKAMEKYESVKQNNNKISVCVQADVVASAYLNANDVAKHAEWEAIKEEDCKAAGVPYY